MRKSYIRAGWFLLSVATAAWLADASTDPLLQITDCEIGLGTTFNCNETIASYFGISLVLAVCLPVILCLVPAIFTRPGVASGMVFSLFALFSIGLFMTVAGSSEPHVMAIYIYLLPVVLIALALAATVRWARARQGAVRIK